MEKDIKYCSSSFLMYRQIIDSKKTFSNNLNPHYKSINENREKIHNSIELYNSLKKQIENVISNGKKVALALSGGIDSAILAKLLPEGTQTYTFKCVVPGKNVIDESIMAKKYANECKLKHKVIEIYWEDFEKYSELLMRKKGTPIHSIEVQIYKASLQAKKDGVDVLIFGESSDCLYGGLSKLLSKDWTFGEFVDRYSFVKPYYVLKEFDMDLLPVIKYNNNGIIDVHSFLSDVFFKESVNSYYNACEAAGIECLIPFANTLWAEKIDLERIRKGENKYLVRQIFEKLYNGFDIPEKTPMPRPMAEWLENWNGPVRKEFLPNCVKNLTGDQKWLVWSLEKFLNILDE